MGRRGPGTKPVSRTREIAPLPLFADGPNPAAPTASPGRSAGCVAAAGRRDDCLDRGADDHQRHARGQQVESCTDREGPSSATSTPPTMPAPDRLVRQALMTMQRTRRRDPPHRRAGAGAPCGPKRPSSAARSLGRRRPQSGPEPSIFRQMKAFVPWATPS